MKTKYETISKNMYNSSEEEFGLRRGPWNFEEDNLLIHYINCHGEGRWNWLAKCAGLRRTGKSCRLRWLNYLKPDIKRGNLTPHEQLLILELHSRWGNRWSKIALHLPGRTDNEIKNYWRTRVQKQARQLKIDANSKKFLEVIRCVWMPRLLDKMEQSSFSSSSSSTSTSSSSSSYSSSSSSMENKDSTFAPLTANQAILGSTNADMKKLKSSNWSIERALSLPTTEENQIPPPSCRNKGHCNSIDDEDCYYFDTASYINSEYISDHQTMSAMGCPDMSLSEYLMSETDWFNEEVAGSIWNTDELWQLRKAGEILSPENGHPTI